MNEGTKLLHRELDGELTADEARTLDRVCRTDPDLRRERDAWAHVLQGCEPHDPGLPPGFSARLERAMAERPRPSRRMPALAVALGLLIVAAVAGVRFRPGLQPRSPAIAPTASTQMPVRIVAQGRIPLPSEPVSIEF